MKDMCYILAIILVGSISLLAWGAPTGNIDPSLAWMQAAGFPTWAVVVWWGVTKVTKEIQRVSMKVDQFITYTERRLTNLETRLEIKPPQNFIGSG